MADLTSTVVLETAEWTLVHRTAGTEGATWIPVFRRNGVIMDVPTDPAERAAFKDKYPYNPVTDENVDSVFVYRPLQLYISGFMGHGNIPPMDMADKVSCVYPADSHQPKLADTPPLVFPGEFNGFCCIPKESLLMWGRASAITDQDVSWIVQDRGVARQRLLLCQGTVSVTGVTYDAPAVIPLLPNDIVYADTKVYAAEVWV